MVAKKDSLIAARDSPTEIRIKKKERKRAIDFRIFVFSRKLSTFATRRRFTYLEYYQ
jgi:hypothetical protein